MFSTISLFYSFDPQSETNIKSTEETVPAPNCLLSLSLCEVIISNYRGRCHLCRNMILISAKLKKALKLLMLLLRVNSYSCKRSKSNNALINICSEITTSATVFYKDWVYFGHNWMHSRSWACVNQLHSWQNAVWDFPL